MIPNEKTHEKTLGNQFWKDFCTTTSCLKPQKWVSAKMDRFQVLLQKVCNFIKIGVFLSKKYEINVGSFTV